MSDPYQATLGFNDHQVAELAKRAVTPEQAQAAGVIPAQHDEDLILLWGTPDYWTEANGYLPGMLYPLVSPTPGVAVQYQLKPDTPHVNEDGSVSKYLFPKGFRPVLHVARHVPGAMRALLVEGTHQVIAAAVYAPPECSVYGISGCWSWQSGGEPTEDLMDLSGTSDAIIVLDADAGTNLQVYEAGLALAAELAIYGVDSVKFAQVPGRGKDGLDDVLAKRPEAVRHRLIELMITEAIAKPAAKKPSATEQARKEAAARREERQQAPGGMFFDPVSGGLLVKTLSEFIRESYPAALSAEGKVAMYDNGVYGIDGLSFLSAITQLLGERFVASHHSNAEKFTMGELANEGRFLPDRMTAPVLNVPNGMLDLVSGELLPHSPDYFSTAQFAVPWEPDATAPTYERWLKESIGAGQMADLEEAASAILDPSTTPTKALFLFGPSRSGKSTFLRLLMALAGSRNTSGVTLHQLVENRFMAANVYGKLLNVAADLSANHVEDLSIFKLMTGEDLIMADRKYGGQFSFTNRALFAFSANELPTVGEGSRAYSERIKPFQFGRTFAGAEKPEIELAMLQELPGILVRLVAAWRARRERGTALVTDPQVRETFEIASDKVRQFVVQRLVIGKGFMTTTEIHRELKEWAADEGKLALGRTKMAARLETIPGVERVTGPNKTRGWNLSKLPASMIDNEIGSRVGPPVAELVAELGSEDKTDTALVGVGKTDKTPTMVAELQSSPTTPPAIFVLSYQDQQGEKVKNHILAYRGNSATLQPDNSDSYANPDQYLIASAHQYTSLCAEGHEEILVDGLWFACPICYPATARTAPVESE
jgi:putative DNA primase/helicase